MSRHTDAAIEALGLRADDLFLEGEVNAGYADALEASEAREAWPVIASCRLIAASCWALADPRNARAAFRLAARTYRRLGLPYAVILAICAGEREDAGDVLPNEQASVSATPDVALEVLLASTLLRADLGAHWYPPWIQVWDEWTVERIEHWRVGRLGLPLRLYANALRRSEEAHRGLVVLLERAAEEVRAAQADEYNWQQLRSGMLPLEPEILATCMVALSLYSATGTPAERLRMLLMDHGLSRLGAAPLLAAIRLADVEA